MGTNSQEFYVCEVCKAQYNSKEEAKICEDRPISQDKGAKVRGKVLITSGDGAGKYGRVKRKYIISKDWGHYLWERYWHTVGLEVEVIDSWGNRQLTFDDYEVVKK